MLMVFSSDLVKSVASSRRISGAFASERSSALVKTALATLRSMFMIGAMAQGRSCCQSCVLVGCVVCWKDGDGKMGKRNRDLTNENVDVTTYDNELRSLQKRTSTLLETSTWVLWHGTTLSLIHI